MIKWIAPLLLGAAAATQALPTPAPLSLQQAEELALRNHPLLQAAAASAGAAAQETREARAAFYPTVTGEVSGVAAESGSRIEAGALGNSSVYDREADGLTVNQLITDFGRTSSLVKSAGFEAQAAASGAQATRQSVLLGAAQAYFEVLRRQDLLDVARETVAERQTVVNQVSALTQAALRSQLDLSFAKVNLAQAQVDLVAAQNDLEAAFAQLSAALGLPGSSTFTLLPVAAPAAPVDDVTPLVQQAIAARPDLAALRLQTQSEQSFAQAESDLNRPTLSALGVTGVAPWAQDPLGSRYAAAGVNLSIPIFNGFDFNARAQAAKLQATAGEQRLRELQDLVDRDVRTAWLAARTAYQQVDLTQQMLDQANLALQLAQSRYNLGLSSIVELSQSQLNQAQAATEHTNAIFNYQSSQAGLQYQLGALP